MRLPEGQQPTAWVKRLPEVVCSLNGEITRLIGKKPAEAIKEKAVAAKLATPYLRPFGKKNENKLSVNAYVCYLYQNGELEGGRQLATDHNWSVKVYNVRARPT